MGLDRVADTSASRDTASWPHESGLRTRTLFIYYAFGQASSFSSRIQLVLTNLLRTELVRRLLEIASEIGHCCDVGPDRLVGIVPQPKILDHSAPREHHPQRHLFHRRPPVPQSDQVNTALDDGECSAIRDNIT